MELRRSKDEIEAKIARLRKLRAGSIFSRTFEAGMVYALYWVLCQEPELKTREDVRKFEDELIVKVKSSMREIYKELREKLWNAVFESHPKLTEAEMDDLYALIMFGKVKE